MKTSIHIVERANFNGGTGKTTMTAYANIQSRDRGAYDVINYAYFNNYIQLDTAITIAGVASPLVGGNVEANSRTKFKVTLASVYKYVKYVTVTFPANYAPLICYADTTSDMTPASMTFDLGTHGTR
jgi:hypothetical protein